MFVSLLRVQEKAVTRGRQIYSCKCRATLLDSKCDHVSYWCTVGPFAQAIEEHTHTGRCAHATDETHLQGNLTLRNREVAAFSLKSTGFKGSIDPIVGDREWTMPQEGFPSVSFVPCHPSLEWRGTRGHITP